MKKILLLFALLFINILLSQKTISTNIGEFTELKVYDLINVELIKSKENKVEINGKNKDNVVIVNKNGVLKIRLNLKESFSGNNTNIKLYYDGLNIIDANEGAFIYSKDNIKQYELEVKAQEGAKIKIDLETKETTSKTTTGGVIELTGTTQNQTISISTGGILKASKLLATNTNVIITTGGEAFINTSNILDIKIRAGGDIYIYGNPKKVNKNKVLGGRIKYMN